MRFLRPVVSWCTILILLHRSAVLGWPWALDRLQVPPPKSWGPWQYNSTLNFPRIHDAMAWSPAWALVALCLIAPALAFLHRLIFRSRPAPGDLAPAQSSLLVSPQENPWPDRLNLAGRWGFAILFLAALVGVVPEGVAAFLMLDPEWPSWGFWTPLSDLFMTFFFGILSAVLIAPEVSQLASSGFTGFIDAVFFPNDRDRIPPYTLKLARFYVQQNRWAEADAEFERVLSHHPQRLEAWVERLEAACRRPPLPATHADPDPDSTPEAILADALKNLKSPTDRDTIHTRFTQLRF